MNELILDSLMRIFAIIGIVAGKSSLELNKVFFEAFLKQYISKQIIDAKINLFTNLVNDLAPLISNENYLNETIDELCTHLNNELRNSDKLLIIIHLAEYIKHHRIQIDTQSHSQEKTSELLHYLVSKLNFNIDDYYMVFYFIDDKVHKISNKKSIALVTDGVNNILSGYKQVHKEGFRGILYVLYVPSGNTFLIRYKGDSMLIEGNRILYPDHIYHLNNGAVIQYNEEAKLYYNEIASVFLAPEELIPLHYQISDIDFTFKGTDTGVHKLTFAALSGQMVGIMGGSGSGKSTVLNILNGSIIPSSGTLKINGFDFQQNKQSITPLMGYIPQDDILLEELTVYENLHYCASLTYGNLSREQIDTKCRSLLEELILIEYQNLKVGSPVNKVISGGQRKRLNIALELIRDPAILFVDEPTSGLSTADSRRMMDLLRQQAYKGKLLFVNIHQPSSEIFKLFDAIIILDKGGYVVYSGNPVDAIRYFKKTVGRVDAEEAECARCGNISSEIILDILEYPQIDAFGNELAERKIAPISWHRRYLEKNKSAYDSLGNEKLPEKSYQIPTLWRQFVIYTRRNIAVKFADKQYLAISLLVAPLLAFILAFISKYSSVNN